MECKFDLAWRGECGKESENGYCPEHNRKCKKCGEQILGECDYASSFVCGYDICKNNCHNHD